jgi:hypothetical protein
MAPKKKTTAEIELFDDSNPKQRIQKLDQLKSKNYENADALIISDFYFPLPEEKTMIRIQEAHKRGTRFYDLCVDGDTNCKEYWRVLDKIIDYSSQEYTFKINPHFRLQSSYLHAYCCLVDDGVLQTESHFASPSKVYMAYGKCSVIAIRRPDKLAFVYSNNTNWENVKLQNWLRLHVKDYVITVAERELPQRLHYWEKEKNLYAKGVTVKKLKSDALGRCVFPKGLIDSSPKIILLPQHGMDCVILHEMAHLKYPHHSKSFWKFLSILIRHTFGGGHDQASFVVKKGCATKADMLMALTGTIKEPYLPEDFSFLQIEMLKLFKQELNKIKNFVDNNAKRQYGH